MTRQNGRLELKKPTIYTSESDADNDDDNDDDDEHVIKKPNLYIWESGNDDDEHVISLNCRVPKLIKNRL